MTSVSDVLLLVNERAGGNDAAAAADVAAALASVATVEVLHAAAADELDAALDQAAGRTIAVLGGDGSLHVVVDRIRQRGELADTDLALLPCGTGNDFARTVGMALEPIDAATALAHSVRRPLDLLVDDRDCVVVNVVHAGVGADAAARAAGLKGTLGPAAYPLGAIAAAVNTEGWQVAVDIDGAAVDVPGGLVLMVAVCNGRSVGGGSEICPLADPADGLLDVILVTATDPTARLGFGNDLRRGVHLDRDDVLHRRGREVTVRGEPIGYNADGELGEPVAMRSFRIEPRAWSLRVPAER